MNKRIKSIIVVGIVAMIMTACSSKPSKKEIMKAIEDGRMSAETVMNDELMTKEELIDAGVIEIVEAVSKMEVCPKLNDFKTTDMNGNEVTQELFKEVKNGTKIVFWKTSSEESIQEIKELNEVYAQAKESGFEIVGIVMDSENEEKAKEICADIEFPNILFTDSMKESLGDGGMSMLEEFPTSNQSDSEGNLIYAWTIGVSDKEALKKLYEENK